MSHLSDLFVDATWLFWVPGFGYGVTLPDAAVTVSLIFAGAGAAILGKFTGHIGAFTMPINYAALLIGALIGNWLLADLHLPIDRTLQAPMLFALFGMCIMGLTMMFVVRRD